MNQAVAVLTSGGLDSAILLADLCRTASRCVPIYVRAGLAWETVELEYLQNYWSKLKPQRPSLEPIVLLDQPVKDLYGSHWSVVGHNVPDAATPDEAVYLPGRNLLLILKALLWCHLNGVRQLALGVLASNPFPDASAGFFDRLAGVIGEGVGDRALKVICPYGNLHKAEVMKRGAGLPLEWSFSCIMPVRGLHCGECNKCAERQHAFAAAQMVDVTQYARKPACTA